MFINFVSTSELSSVFAKSITVFNVSVRSANNCQHILPLIHPHANLSCNASSKGSLSSLRLTFVTRQCNH